MSVLTTLALMVTSLARRPKDAEPEEIADLKKQVEDLKRERDNLLEALYYELPTTRQAAAQFKQQAHLANQQMFSAQNSNQQLLCSQGILSQQHTYQAFCNCVPARHDFFGLNL